ncbi:MAG: hypothetical protein JW776_13335 [Candidatus Lokiarchaeota archaeon]|nr:hypothetical protein [Candidatus Lokiarchaeota archaeon]
MADIFPIPDSLVYLHGILKLAVAVTGIILLVLTIRKHIKKSSQVSSILIIVFLAMILGLTFASFDDLFGWENLLGSQTWVGFGLSTIFNSLANSSYLALYIAIFMAQDKWKSKHIIFLVSFGLVDLTAAVLSMGYYAFGWIFYPSIIPSAIHMIFAAVLYTFWLVQCTRIIKTLTEEDYIRRFRSFQISSILILLSVIAFAITGFSETRSYITWVGLGFLSLGLLFSYLGFLKTKEQSK